MYSIVRSLWTIVYISIYSYLFALKPFNFTYMEMKLFENTFPPYENLQILGIGTFHFTSPLTAPLVKSNAENSCLKFATEERCDLSISLDQNLFFPGNHISGRLLDQNPSWISNSAPLFISRVIIDQEQLVVMFIFVRRPWLAYSEDAVNKPVAQVVHIAAACW
jgi:hypothetical protein